MVKESSFPELAFELNDEESPRVIDIASSNADSVRDETNQEVPKIEKSPTKGNVQNSEIAIKPTNGQNEAIKEKQPTRVLERRRIPTKCYGIEVMRVRAKV